MDEETKYYVKNGIIISVSLLGILTIKYILEN